MAYDQKDGDIAIFLNDKKMADNQPDWQGKLRWNGQELEIALWDKPTGTMKSGKIQIKRVRNAGDAQNTYQAQTANQAKGYGTNNPQKGWLEEVEDDAIPF